MQEERGEKQKHSSSKEYSCTICGKSFPTKSRLTRHERVHTGEKPYECDICKKTFGLSSDLTRHTRVHTGEKPYLCEVCQKSYTRSSTLSKHNKTDDHIKRAKDKNTNIPVIQTSFVDCGNGIKLEDIKEEINEEESVDDPISIHQKDESSNVCGENIKVESIKEEVSKDESAEDPLSIQLKDRTESRGPSLNSTANNGEKRGKKCENCQKLFPEQYFRAHEKLHSEDKFHPCKLCGIVFNSKDYLIRHKNGDIMYEVLIIH